MRSADEPVFPSHPHDETPLPGTAEALELIEVEGSGPEFSISGAFDLDDYTPEPSLWTRISRVSGVIPIMLLVLIGTGLFFLGRWLYNQWLEGETDSPAAAVVLPESRELETSEGASLLELRAREEGPRLQLQEGAEPGATASILENVTFEKNAAGTTVTLWGNGDFTPSGAQLSTIGGDQPRALIKIAGINQPYNLNQFPLRTPEVTQLRFGFHIGRDVNELHVVADLADPRARVTEVRFEPGKLIWRFVIPADAAGGS